MAQEVLNRKFADNYPASANALREALDKLAAVETLCLRFNNPSVVTGAHLLANKVLAIVREGRTETESTSKN